MCDNKTMALHIYLVGKAWAGYTAANFYSFEGAERIAEANLTNINGIPRAEILARLAKDLGDYEYISDCQVWLMVEKTNHETRPSDNLIVHTYSEKVTTLLLDWQLPGSQAEYNQIVYGE